MSTVNGTAPLTFFFGYVRVASNIKQNCLAQSASWQLSPISKLTSSILWSRREKSTQSPPLCLSKIKQNLCMAFPCANGAEETCPFMDDWLVVDLPLWKMVGGLLFPIYGKTNVPNHQPHDCFMTKRGFIRALFDCQRVTSSDIVWCLERNGQSWYVVDSGFQSSPFPWRDVFPRHKIRMWDIYIYIAFLHCIILCYTILYYIMLYYIILNYIKLY